MRLKDTPWSFGWLSIAVHWITAIAIAALLLAGSSIGAGDGDGDAALLVHTTIALCAFPFLWWRIIWRYRAGHPGPLAEQSRIFHAIGKAVHYLMLVAIAIMLLSGPLMAWSGGLPIRVGDLFTAPAILPVDRARFIVLNEVHRSGAVALAAMIGLHIAGVIKHALFDRDGTFDRMLTPGTLDEAAGIERFGPEFSRQNKERPGGD